MAVAPIATTGFYSQGAANLTGGGQHAHGWGKPVAGVGLPPMSNPNSVPFSIQPINGLNVSGGGMPQNGTVALNTPLTSMARNSVFSAMQQPFRNR